MRLSSPTQTAILYTQECQYCANKPVQHNGQTTKCVYDKGNFDAVSKFIMKEIVEGGRIVRINELTALYGLGDLSNIKTSYENLLKQFGQQCYIAI